MRWPEEITRTDLLTDISGHASQHLVQFPPSRPTFRRPILRGETVRTDNRGGLPRTSLTRPSEVPGLTVSTSDFLWFSDQALVEMGTILRQLGDDTANSRPDLEGANSPYAILTHCLGVMECWGGHMIAGRVIERDRDTEFRAEGSVAALILRTAAARGQLVANLNFGEPTAAPRYRPDPEDAELPYSKTQGAVLLHLFEELTQHLGQMQFTRDVLLSVG